MPNQLSEAELEVAEHIVTALNLEVDPGTIDPKAASFYDGLGLDSIETRYPCRRRLLRA